MKTAALILAGGLGLRMNPEEQANEPPKQFFRLGDKPVLIHTLDRFEQHPEIDWACVVCLPMWKPYVRDLIAEYGLKKVRWIASGGVQRQESVYNGLCALANECPPETMVVVHDGVRPFITAEIITQNIGTALEHNNAMTGMRSTDTLITSEDGIMSRSAMDRDSTFTIQTPQTYRLGYGLELYRKAMALGMTDTINCCEMFIALGETVHIVEGRKTNVKLTTRDDIAYLRFLNEIFHEQEKADERNPH